MIIIIGTGSDRSHYDGRTWLVAHTPAWANRVAADLISFQAAYFTDGQSYGSHHHDHGDDARSLADCNSNVVRALIGCHLHQHHSRHHHLHHHRRRLTTAGDDDDVVVVTLVVDEVTGSRKKKMGGGITTTITTSSSSSNSYYIINTIIWPAFPRPQRAAGLGEHEIGQFVRSARRLDTLLCKAPNRVSKCW